MKAGLNQSQVCTYWVNQAEWVEEKPSLTIVRMFLVINCRHYSVICHSQAHSEKLKYNYKTKEFLFTVQLYMNDMWSFVDQNREENKQSTYAKMSMSTMSQEQSHWTLVNIANQSSLSSLSSSSSTQQSPVSLWWQLCLLSHSGLVHWWMFSLSKYLKYLVEFAMFCLMTVTLPLPGIGVLYHVLLHSIAPDQHWTCTRRKSNAKQNYCYEFVWKNPSSLTLFNSKLMWYSRK